MFVASEVVVVRYLTLVRSRELTSMLPTHLLLQVFKMETMWLCSYCCYIQDWTERFHTGLTQPVANAVYKSSCLAGMCSIGNTQR